jgi:hypothetical protein
MGVRTPSVATTAGAFAYLEPQVALLGQTRSETLAPQRRRARHAADSLLMPDSERAPARATLAYYNQVGDPSV